MTWILWSVLLAAAPVFAQGFAGTWQGTLEAGAIKVRLGLHVVRSPSGAYSATFDNIDQAVAGIPVDVFRVSQDLLHFEIKSLRAAYDGQLTPDGSTIDGELTEAVALPLKFRRVARVETLRRPQQPRPPFPYLSQDVTFPSGKIQFGGTLTRPAGAGPFAAVALVSDAGPQDRDASVAGHKPFLVIADFLTRRGIAVLRVDDRGVGGSGGDTIDATIEDQASDAQAAAAYLRSKKEIDAKRIGLIGLGQGAVVAALAASRDSSIAFAALLGGSGVPGEEVMYRLGETVARANGASEAAIEEARGLQKQMVEILRAEPDQFRAIEKIRTAWAEGREILPAPMRAEVDAQIIGAASPEARSFLLHDPAGVLKSLAIPILVLHGSRDLQFLPEQNIPAMVEALTDGRNPDFTVTVLPGLNHLLQSCKTCTVTEYSSIEQTIAPAALDVIGAWLSRQTRR